MDRRSDGHICLLPDPERRIGSDGHVQSISGQSETESNKINSGRFPKAMR